jgi:hypothetical protein
MHRCREEGVLRSIPDSNAPVLEWYVGINLSIMRLETSLRLQSSYLHNFLLINILINQRQTFQIGFRDFRM